MIEENKRFDDEHLCKTYELLNTPKFRNYVYVFDGKGNYCEYIDEYEVKIDELQTQLQQKENIIKEVREYITSYESIETIQQFDHNKNNKDLDYSTIDEMTRRYMMVHDKILKILDKEVN